MKGANRNGSVAWALVPVKRLDRAKSRLACVLSPDERRSLQLAMLGDVLTSLSCSRRLNGMSVVTSDAFVAHRARALGATVIADSGTADLNSALQMGLSALRTAGAETVAVVPSDAPLIKADDIDAALEHVSRHRTTVIAPDRHRLGTNGFFFSTRQTPVFAFGCESLQRHLDENRPADELMLSSLALDIDRIDDLCCLATMSGLTSGLETIAFISRLGTHRFYPSEETLP